MLANLSSKMTSMDFLDVLLIAPAITNRLHKKAQNHERVEFKSFGISALPTYETFRLIFINQLYVLTVITSWIRSKSMLPTVFQKKRLSVLPCSGHISSICRFLISLIITCSGYLMQHIDHLKKYR